MKNTLIHLYSPVEYPIFGLEADFCVNIPSKSDLKVLNMERVEACMHSQADTANSVSSDM